MVASRGDASASRSGTSRTLASEYGANGHGSTRPDGLMWMNPRPAARHPPKTSSSPGNTMNKPRNRFCSEATTATSRARWAPVSYTHLRAHETRHDLVCRLLLEKKKKKKKKQK